MENIDNNIVVGIIDSNNTARSVETKIYKVISFKELISKGFKKFFLNLVSYNHHVTYKKIIYFIKKANHRKNSFGAQNSNASAMDVTFTYRVL